MAMKISARALLQTKSFFGVLALFIAANVWSWVRHQIWPVCCDQEVTVGFPVPFHISGGIAGMSNFYVLGLLLDIVVALTIAVTLTWVILLIRRWQAG